jgi:hypothetical protein
MNNLTLRDSVTISDPDSGRESVYYSVFSSVNVYVYKTAVSSVLDSVWTSVHNSVRVSVYRSTYPHMSKKINERL